MHGNASVGDDRRALLKIAALVSQGAPEQEVFAAVTEAVAKLTGATAVPIFRFEPGDLMRLLAVWTESRVAQPIDQRAPMGTAMRSMRDTPRPMRLDPLPEDAAFSEVGDAMGVSAVVAVPILVERAVWGVVMACYEAQDQIHPDTVRRIDEFIGMVSVALLNAERRTYLQQLIDQQEALRLIGALVASDAPERDVLDAVVQHTARLLRADIAVVVGFHDDQDGEVLASAGQAGVEIGTRWPTTGEGSIPTVLKTGRSARIEDLTGLKGVWPAIGSRLGMASSAAAPITIDGRVWGALAVGSTAGPLSPRIEEQLTSFADLAGSAVAGSHARGQLRLVAEEQGALRRVAELVARGAGQDELFQSVATEAFHLIDRIGITLMRQDPGMVFPVVAIHEGPVPVGTSVVITDEDQGIVANVVRTGRAVRQDNYDRLRGRAWARDEFGVSSGVGVPITVGGRVWGVLGATTQVNEPLPDDVEHRLDQFARLIAAALANAQAREELEERAAEQSALRRVAELVARAEDPQRIFDTVTREAAQLLGGMPTTLLRFEPGREFVLLATAGGPAPPGTRIQYPAGSVADRVRHSGRGERIDDYGTEPDADLAVQIGVRAAVQVPVMVGGSTWGMLSATSPDKPLPPATTRRLVQFADVIGAAVANADSRAQLRASRARLVATADETRHRVQRDLHDGAQQRLVQSVISLKLARRALAEDDREALAELLDDSLEKAERAIADLRDLVRGILPGSLSLSGFAAAAETLARDLPIPVDVDVDVPRLPVGLETTAYFITAEALTNVVKHAAATRAGMIARVDGDELLLEIHDDGRGGAEAGGSGLTGLRDRVDALEGTLRIESPAGGGTRLRATLPLHGEAAEPH
jgi:GAF domain-containing protein